MTFSFDKLVPPPLNKRIKVCFKSFFQAILVQKTVSEVLKGGIFLILRFVRQTDGGGGYSPLPLWLRY